MLWTVRWCLFSVISRRQEPQYQAYALQLLSLEYFYIFVCSSASHRPDFQVFVKLTSGIDWFHVRVINYCWSKYNIPVMPLLLFACFLIWVLQKPRTFRKNPFPYILFLNLNLKLKVLFIFRRFSRFRGFGQEVSFVKGVQMQMLKLIFILLVWWYFYGTIFLQLLF